MSADSTRQMSEEELRAALVRGDDRRGALDVDTIIRRSRRHRRARAIATTGVAALAVVAIAGIGVSVGDGLRLPVGVSMLADDSMRDGPEPLGAADPFAAEAEEGIALAPPQKLNPCGAPVTELAADALGLVLTPRFDARAPADGLERSGTVSLGNTGGEVVRATVLVPPVVTLSLDGVTVWHSSGPSVPTPVDIDLAPGESVDFDAAFTPVRCDATDEAGETFRPDLPPLLPGTYELGAVVQVTPVGTAAPWLVGGPRQPIALE